MQTTLLFILSLIFALSNADLQLQLSVGRINIAAASVGTKALFAGGLLAPEIEGGLEIATDLVDIYDVSTGLWAQANLSAPGSSLLALSVGAKVLFCGGLNGTNIVDIYDDESGEWTTHELNENREFIKGTVVGTKAIIGGGRSLIGGILGISDIVEIYDSETGLWTTSLPLLTARISAAVTNVANWALFIGGLDGEGNILGDIDIYDVDANTWTSTNLSVVRTELSAVSVGGLYAVIAGGLTLENTISDVCEIFNGVNWTLSVLPEARYQMAAATDGLRAYFIGGISDLVSLAASARVDIYNPETDTWTLKTLVEARLNVAAINVGLRVFVAGGGNYSDACEVFEPEMETPTPVDTPTPVVETPTPVIVPTPTPGATPTPTPTPGATPTPTPTPTPSPTVGPIQCRLDCLTDFDNGKEGIVERTHFTDRCKVWTDYRDCLANCEDSTVEQEAQRAVCNIEPYIGELCDCSGDGGGQPIAIRLALILADFEDIFLSYFNDINGCQDAAWPEALATLLRFTFRYENTATNMDQIAIDLKALLGLYLNQNPERFVFGNNKREIVDGALTVEVVEPPPPAGSAAGVTVSFVFFLVIALFHLF